MRVLVHVTDLAPWGNQRRITAICGKRVAVSRVMAVRPFEKLPPETYHSYGKLVPCVGCRALLAERAKDSDYTSEAK
jgi:hypothetical protein